MIPKHACYLPYETKTFAYCHKITFLKKFKSSRTRFRILTKFMTLKSTPCLSHSRIFV